MVTVKDVVAILKDPKDIRLAWEGFVYELDPANALMMDAYGDYVVKSIGASNGDGSYETNIAMSPIKAGCAV